MAVVETSADHAAPRAEEPGSGSDAGEREMRDLEDLLSKLNPMAEEFVPPSLASPVAAAGAPAAAAFAPAPLSPAAFGYYPANGAFAVPSPAGHRGVVGFPAAADGPAGRGGRKKGGPGFGGHGHPGRRRTNSRTTMAQRDEVIRRTVYVSDIDHQVFGSAGVIGNPMGFARNVGFGLKDFISASRKGKLQSPVELLNGIAQGSKTLIGSTVYAVSSATSHFSKTAYKGLVAFTYDEQAASKIDERERQLGLRGEGVLNGFLEGLTGLLQSPIRGAEKHGLPGVISGLAMGTAGLVARPMASILEATGRTAQSIRNRSNPHESNRLRVRFPRPVARDHPLFPYSWEEAIGVSLLIQADSGRLKEETFVMCKALKEPGKFVVLTEKLLLLVSSPYLVDLGTPQFVGVPLDPQWSIGTEMNLKSIVHLDRSQEVVNIVGSNGETSPRDRKVGVRGRAVSSAFIPLFHLSVELPNIEDAEGTLQILQALIEKGKARRWDKNILHRSNIS